MLISFGKCKMKFQTPPTFLKVIYKNLKVKSGVFTVIGFDYFFVTFCHSQPHPKIQPQVTHHSCTFQKWPALCRPLTVACPGILALMLSHLSLQIVVSPLTVLDIYSVHVHSVSTNV